MEQKWDPKIHILKSLLPSPQAKLSNYQKYACKLPNPPSIKLEILDYLVKDKE